MSVWRDGFPGRGNGEAAGAGEGGVFAELLMNELRFGRLPDKHQSEKTFQQGEETFGRPSGETRRDDAGTEALRSDGDFGCWRSLG